LECFAGHVLCCLYHVSAKDDLTDQLDNILGHCPYYLLVESILNRLHTRQKVRIEVGHGVAIANDGKWSGDLGRSVCTLYPSFLPIDDKCCK